MRHFILSGSLSLIFGIYSLYNLCQYLMQQNETIYSMQKQIDELSEKINMIHDELFNYIDEDINGVINDIDSSISEIKEVDIDCNVVCSHINREDIVCGENEDDNIVSIDSDSDNSNKVEIQSSENNKFIPLNIDIICSETECFVPIENTDLDMHLHLDLTDLNYDGTPNKIQFQRTPPNMNLYMDISEEDVNKIIPEEEFKENNYMNDDTMDVDWFKSTKLLTKYIIFGNQR
jgi:hypothetical protein